MIFFVLERNKIFSSNLVSPIPIHTQINDQVKVALTSALPVLVCCADFRQGFLIPWAILVSLCYLYSWLSLLWFPTFSAYIHRGVKIVLQDGKGYGTWGTLLAYSVICCSTEFSLWQLLVLTCEGTRSSRSHTMAGRASQQLDLWTFLTDSLLSKWLILVHLTLDLRKQLTKEGFFCTMKALYVIRIWLFLNVQTDLYLNIFKM